jgi:hypothetical protein
MKFSTTRGEVERIALNSFSSSASLRMAGAYSAGTAMVSQIGFGRSVDPGDIPRRWSLSRNLFSSTLRFRISSDWLIGLKFSSENVKSYTHLDGWPGAQQAWQGLTRSHYVPVRPRRSGIRSVIYRLPLVRSVFLLSLQGPFSALHHCSRSSVRAP